MSLLLPPELQFRWILPIPRVDRLPGDGKPLGNLPAEAQLTIPHLLNGPNVVAAWKGAWNSHGLAFSIEVTGKSSWSCNPDRPLESDGIHLWIDTRDTQSVHRATRFCHMLCVLPSGGGESGREPVVVPVPVPRASQDAKLADSDDYLVTAEMTKSGYRMAVWIPASTLTGFDPSSQPRIGFFAQLKDKSMGTHPIALGPEFPYDGDPSLWLTLEMTP
ncbi:MAG: hypothetical protein U0929_02690 [Planctomycetaceae bacterium]